MNSKFANPLAANNFYTESAIIPPPTDMYLGNYPKELSNKPFLQLGQSNLTTCVRNLSIDSADRDRDIWPDPSRYQVKLEPSDTFTGAHTNRRYKNVIAIELLTLCVPDKGMVAKESYILLDIEELHYDMYDATNTQTRNAFAKIFLQRLNVDSIFLCMNKEFSDPLILNFFQAPMGSLSKLTINIRRKDGTLFNFGTDTDPPAKPNPELQNTMTFKITTSTSNTDIIPRRNI